MTSNEHWMMRLLVAAGGVSGAVGVMAAAAASHGEEVRNLSAIAAICLAHGPALLALGLAGRGRVLMAGGLALVLGTLVFAGDLGIRHWLGHGAFPGAAPIGGGVMILGWFGIVIGGCLLPRKI